MKPCSRIFPISTSKKMGSVSSMIVKGDREITTAKLTSLSPVLLDILPLTLEEVFTYEMESLGYNFDKILEEKDEEQKEII